MGFGFGVWVVSDCERFGAVCWGFGNRIREWGIPDYPKPYPMVGVWVLRDWGLVGIRDLSFWIWGALGGIGVKRRIRKDQKQNEKGSKKMSPLNPKP